MIEGIALDLSEGKDKTLYKPALRLDRQCVENVQHVPGRVIHQYPDMVVKRVKRFPIEIFHPHTERFRISSRKPFRELFLEKVRDPNKVLPSVNSHVLPRCARLFIGLFMELLNKHALKINHTRIDMSND